MYIFFDYIFYRVTRFFYKWDGRDGIRGIIAVSMIQTISLAVIVLISFKLLLREDTYAPHSKNISYVGVAILVFFYAVNYFRYKNQYISYKIRWKYESERDCFYRGVGVVFVLLVPWILLIVISTFF
jgi:hypothetical protein